jgi:predicted nucleotidyltransferase
VLDTLITNKTRLKLLLKFFLNGTTRGYLRKLEVEFGESSNAIRLELNRFEKAGLLTASYLGNKKIFQANTSHPLFNDINNILKKEMGIDLIIEKITSRIGDLKEAYLTGEIAKGKESNIIDLVLIGKSLDRLYITSLIEKTEELIQRKISFIILEEQEKPAIFDQSSALLIWKEQLQQVLPSAK